MSELTKLGSVSPAVAGGASTVVKHRERRDEQATNQQKRKREDRTPDAGTSEDLDADQADLSYEARLRLSTENAAQGKTPHESTSETDTPGAEQPGREDPSSRPSRGPRSSKPKGGLIDERC